MPCTTRAKKPSLTGGDVGGGGDGGGGRGLFADGTTAYGEDCFLGALPTSPEADSSFSLLAAGRASTNGHGRFLDGIGCGFLAAVLAGTWLCRFHDGVIRGLLAARRASTNGHGRFLDGIGRGLLAAGLAGTWLCHFLETTCGGVGEQAILCTVTLAFERGVWGNHLSGGPEVPCISPERNELKT